MRRLLAAVFILLAGCDTPHGTVTAVQRVPAYYYACMRCQDGFEWGMDYNGEYTYHYSACASMVPDSCLAPESWVITVTADGAGKQVFNSRRPYKIGENL